MRRHVLGLLVTTGRVTDTARGYAEHAEPRVYIAAPKELAEVLKEVLAPA